MGTRSPRAPTRARRPTCPTTGTRTSSHMSPIRTTTTTGWNVTRHCTVGGTFDLLGRNSLGWTESLYTKYRLFDGYSGASSSCTS